MKKSDIYEIAIKLLGLYLFMTTAFAMLQEISSTFVMLNYNKQNLNSNEATSITPYLILGISNFVIMTSLSLFLIFKSRFVTKKICSASDFEVNTRLFAEQKVIYEIGITLTGFIIMLWTLPEFGLKLKNYIQTEQNELNYAMYDKSYLIITGIKIALGLFIVLGAKSISNYFGRNSNSTIEDNSNNTI